MATRFPRIKTRSLEQRLYEAFREGRGVHLSADDVQLLLRLDDAIQTRITNQAQFESGYDPQGHAGCNFGVPCWRELGRLDESLRR